ncbi:hypothetical protein PR048_020731 [Dryococelus australis]|uniref:Uncharacterized protein n=1 Tax=Dryococelus australis TaxID=614101 RepID=A0ABQ9H765_9NEOP|nr:hypothetical protein PR048_020731 [Dryococelus australis]
MCNIYEKLQYRTPSPVVTLVYLDEFLPLLVDFFKSAVCDDTSSATEYFKQLGVDEITILKCVAEFVVEHSDVLETLIGFLYPYAHKLYAKLCDFKTGFKVVSDKVFGTETSHLVTSTACLKAAMRVKLATTGQKSKIVFTYDI